MKFTSDLLPASLRAVIIFLTLLALQGRAIEPQSKKQSIGAINVTVLDERSGAPFLAGAHLLLINLDTFHTVEQEHVPYGKFSFTELLPEQYLVIAGVPRHSCLLPAMKTVSVLEGNTVDVKLKLVLNRENPNCLKSIE